MQLTFLLQLLQIIYWQLFFLCMFPFITHHFITECHLSVLHTFISTQTLIQNRYTVQTNTQNLKTWKHAYILHHSTPHNTTVHYTQIHSTSSKTWKQLHKHEYLQYSKTSKNRKTCIHITLQYTTLHNSTLHNTQLHTTFSNT